MNSNNKPIRVLVTGATGTVGSQVLQQAGENKAYEITAFDLPTRAVRKKFKRLPKSIDIVYGDITDSHLLEKVVADKDIVIHLAARIPPLAEEDPEMAHEVNALGTQNVVLAMEKAAPDAHLFFSSSIAVYGDRLKSINIKTTDPLAINTDDTYALNKIEAEDFIKRSSLNWSIFRLTAIMGINNHKVSNLIFHMPLKTPMEIASPEDTGRAFVSALNHLSSINHRIFNLSGGKKCRIDYQDFLNRSFQTFGLGNADFPKDAFASCNFHCGYYADGDDLEKLLLFQEDTIEDHFRKLKKSVPKVQYYVTKLLSPYIKNYLLRKSEPYKAMRSGDQAFKEKFFCQ